VMHICITSVVNDDGVQGRNTMSHEIGCAWVKHIPSGLDKLLLTVHGGVVGKNSVIHDTDLGISKGQGPGQPCSCTAHLVACNNLGSCDSQQWCWLGYRGSTQRQKQTLASSMGDKTVGEMLPKCCQVA